MRKLHYTVLSNVRCPKCGKLLKQRMVDQKLVRPTCYQCHLKAELDKQGISLMKSLKIERELHSPWQTQGE